MQLDDDDDLDLRRGDHALASLHGTLVTCDTYGHLSRQGGHPVGWSAPSMIDHRQCISDTGVRMMLLAWFCFVVSKVLLLSHSFVLSVSAVEFLIELKREYLAQDTYWAT